MFFRHEDMTYMLFRHEDMKYMFSCLLVKSISSQPVFLSSCQKNMSSCQKNNITNLQQYGKKKLGARGGL